MKERRLEAGCAHAEVVAPQQQWFGQQLSLWLAWNEVAEASTWDDSGWGGCDCAIAWWHGIAGCADTDWRMQCMAPGWAQWAIASGPKAGASMTSSRNLALQR